MTPQESSEPAPDPLAVFARTRFIMVRPSHPGNVGSAARALKTMGFDGLHLVAPRDPAVAHHPEAVALASGAGDLLETAQIHASLAEALAPATLSFALTARPRALGPQVCDIREAAERSAQALANPRHRVALVVGTERSGLSNDELGLCQYACHIPANPAYSSLNVAQALQLCAWELRYALLPLTGQARLPDTHGRHDPGGDPADSAQVAALLEHLEQAMQATGFLDPDHPKKLVPRMRQLWIRAQPSVDEVDMLRGLCTAMIRSRARHTDTSSA
ncbi:RNA methyltransferase [Castellaniella sp.]|uniref:RNA methyltransferase n=1 Tax=Castellaniella sp. TaxID=1955812 RepID=UPI003569C34A